ncbi:MAG: DUF1015 family protein [bacterium]
MVKIRAFKALRPPPEFVQDVASLPYDVLNSSMARRLSENNPKSFLRVIKPEIELDSDIDPYHESVYLRGAENLNKFMEKGWLVKDEKPSLYAYRLEMNGHIQTGLGAALSCSDYENGIIKEHEKTREIKENDRVQHILKCKAHTGPIFLVAPRARRFKEILGRVSSNQPVYDFVSSDRIRHTLWTIQDENTIRELTGFFALSSQVYIADGHHRSAAAVRVCRLLQATNPSHNGEEEYNFFLGVIFPEDEMRIMEYNRAVRDLNGLSPDEFIKKVEEKFKIHEATAPLPANPHTFGIYVEKQWKWATARQGTFNAYDPVGHLDVSILQNNILSPILGINDPRRDKRIEFIGGIYGAGELERLVDSGKFAAAFSLYPVYLDDLLNIADARETMPPKSTWFEPKLRSGIITHLID